MSYGYKTSLKLDGIVHDASVVSYAYDKSINNYGDVTGPVEGGKIHLSLPDIPKNSILEWGIQPRNYKSGIIEVTGIDDDKPIPEEEIDFRYAACVNLKLVYERDFSNYFTTFLTISAERVCFGRNNCWIKKDWTIEDEETVSKDAVDVIDLLPKDVAIDGFLYVAGKKYEIQTFETEFSQADDWKGQPAKEVKGGLLLITLKQKTDEILSNWMFQKGIAYDGLITFAPISRTANAPLQIRFEKGRCISFDKMLGVNIGGQLSLLISPEKLLVNNKIEHTNK
ncbi:MAG: hypothetical protein FWF53_08590 [Candidatus Azobacteroides sp.]|nr:hypothetical protein [Candidatus Azobacteroides sp.]